MEFPKSIYRQSSQNYDMAFIASNYANQLPSQGGVLVIYIIFIFNIPLTLWLAYTLIKNLVKGQVTGPRPMFYREKGQKTMVTVNKTDEPKRFWTAIFMRTCLLAFLLFIEIWFWLARA